MALTKVRGGGVSIFDDEDSNIVIGRGRIGNTIQASDHASFQHRDLGTGSNNDYAILQTASGGTQINSSSGQSLFLNIGNSQGLKVDSNKIVTMENVPCFAVSANNQSWSGSNNEQTIAFSSEEFDNGGHFDTSNYKFTAPVAGRYFFTIAAWVNAFSSSGAAGPGIYIRKNGSSGTGIFMYMYYTGYNGSSVQGAVNLAKDDYVQGKAINYNSSSFTLGGLKMSGFLIG